MNPTPNLIRTRWLLLVLGTTWVAALSDAGLQRPSTRPAERWPVFHGAPSLAGVARGKLPDKPVLRWRFKTGDAVKSSPTVDLGRVFVGSDDGRVYALDLLRGRKLWSFDTGDAVEAAPLILNGRLYVGSAEGFLHAMNVADGKVLWKYPTGDRILGSANWVRAAGAKHPWIVVGSYDNKLHCVDSVTGKAAWTYQTTNFINGTPAVAKGRIAFGGCDASVHVVSAADGSKLASVDVGSYIAGSAALVGDRAYVGHYGGELVCVDILQGQVAWRYSTNGKPVFSTPAVNERYVVFGCRDQRLYCLDRKTGLPVWRVATRGNVDSSPVICEDKVVVGSDDGRLYILDLATGRERWTYEIGQPVASSPAVAGGWIVVGCDDGTVYAFASAGKGKRP